jgi:hypothetical protein
VHTKEEHAHFPNFRAVVCTRACRYAVVTASFMHSSQIHWSLHATYCIHIWVSQRDNSHLMTL